MPAGQSALLGGVSSCWRARQPPKFGPMLIIVPSGQVTLPVVSSKRSEFMKPAEKLVIRLKLLSVGFRAYTYTMPVACQSGFQPAE